MAAGFTYVWQFLIAEDRAAEFELAAGPEGEWARLFRRHPGYLATELLRDVDDPRRYLTVDHWRSREAWEEFRRLYADAYRRLDQRCERLTVDERHLGDFSPVSPPLGS